jgi:hypothetical protein
MNQRIKGRRETEGKRIQGDNCLNLINKVEIILLKILDFSKNICKLPERS